MTSPNFRKHTLLTGKEITAGRDSSQNDLLVSQSKRNDILLHTKAPGSPFVNLGENPTREEIDEAAILCASKSQEFRDKGGNVKVNSFLKNDTYKERSMPSGTWGVKKYLSEIKVNKLDILRFQQDAKME
ncbi:MAG: putative ribosome quality control (RQC) complex YloA/Tae2 family protein [Patescibacteria group bacterium]|jgi:predicted ribosome quality control (RQC) complex YloA/Tae2 family protein